MLYAKILLFLPKQNRKQLAPKIFGIFLYPHRIDRFFYPWTSISSVLEIPLVPKHQIEAPSNLLTHNPYVKIIIIIKFGAIYLCLQFKEAIQTHTAFCFERAGGEERWSMGSA